MSDAPASDKSTHLSMHQSMHQSTHKAKLFINGRSQAVRIPKELAFIGIDAVNVEKRGNAVILTPARKTWESLTELPPADDDYMTIRPRLMKS